MSKDKRPKPTNFDLLRAAAGVGAPAVQVNSPATVIREPDDLWQVVVIGTIDTRQHNPIWYHLIKCITDEELERAKKSLILFTVPSITHDPSPIFQTPSLCQFDIGTFLVSVVPDKLIIQTSHVENRQRIVEVAATAFQVLNEIFVSAYGINRVFNLRTKKMPAKRFLARKLANADLGFPGGDASEANVNFIHHSSDRDTNIQILNSPVDENRINVIYNRHHQITVKENSGYYDVGKMIRESSEDDWKSADDYKSELEKCLTRAED